MSNFKEKFMSLSDFRSIYLPYCLKKQTDGSFIVLNREYKPLGFNTLTHVKYEDYPISTKFKGLTEKQITKVAYNGKMDHDCIFLYNDASIPTSSKENMKNYLDRLQILANLKVKE